VTHSTEPLSDVHSTEPLSDGELWLFA